MKRKLDEFLEKALICYDLPGLAVGIREKEFVYRNTAGFKDIVNREPLLAEDVFHMASVTKLFVGTSILQLCEQGQILLDGRFTAYIPWFQMNDERYRDITIRQLLNHTSGMPDVKDYQWDKPEMDESALERYVRSSEVKDARLLWSPGEGRFAYSNIGYEILGVIIAAVSGMSFEDYVKRNIFEPLEMNDSTLLTFERGIYDAKGKDKSLCTPHEKDKDKKIVRVPHFPYNRAHGPSSTLTSNLYDLEKWALAIFNHKLLKKETQEMAWEKQALVPNNGEYICLSWFCREQNGYVFYGHEGTDDGFRISLWICPERELIIIVCSNISGAPVKKISKHILDLLQ